jgi:hypothetical protein
MNMNLENIDGYPREIAEAFRAYCDGGDLPPLSREARGYVQHCLRKAARNAQVCGEELGPEHHPFLVLLSLEGPRPELLEPFLVAVLDLPS